MGTSTVEFDVTTLRGRRADSRLHRLSMGDIFERMRWSQPDRTVLTGHAGAAENPEGSSVTVAEADDKANQFANSLLATGAQPGEILVMVCENSLESVLVKIGAAKAGVTIAPLNPNLAAEVMAELITDMGARFAVVDAEFTDRVRPVFDAANVNTVTTIAVGGPQPAAAVSFAEFISAASADEPDVTIHGDDIWQIQFTSGTSALPKGVMGSHSKTMFEALASMGIVTRGQRFEFDSVAGIFVSVTYHVSEVLIYAALLAGGRAVVGRRPDARTLAEAIDQHRITTMHVGSPQMLEHLDAELRLDPNLDAGSVTSVLHSFAPLRAESYASVKDSMGTDVLVVGVIGQTEMCIMHRFWIGADEDLHGRTSPQENYVGLPHPMSAAAIMGADGTIRKPGDAGAAGDAEVGGDDGVGEGVYRSPALMAGYFNNPQATSEAFADGWFHGGDAFRAGEKGLRILNDRIKDVIKTGGENVSSIRVESVMSTHPLVDRAVAVGLPHPRWGEAVTVLVRTKPDAVVDEAALIEFAKTRLAGFEAPKAVLFVDEFPETVGNKVKKHELRRQYAGLFDTAVAVGL